MPSIQLNSNVITYLLRTGVLGIPNCKSFSNGMVICLLFFFIICLRVLLKFISDIAFLTGSHSSVLLKTLHKCASDVSYYIDYLFRRSFKYWTSFDTDGMNKVTSIIYIVVDFYSNQRTIDTIRSDFESVERRKFKVLLLLLFFCVCVCVLCDPGGLIIKF